MLTVADHVTNSQLLNLCNSFEPGKHATNERYLPIHLYFWFQFPTVTICNRNNIKKSAVVKLHNQMPGMGDTMKNILKDLYMDGELPPPADK